MASPDTESREQEGEPSSSRPKRQRGQPPKKNSPKSSKHSSDKKPEPQSDSNSQTTFFTDVTESMEDMGQAIGIASGRKPKTEAKKEEEA